jgi:dephospho-CoA kinase
MLIGLTGGLGSGKTTVADLFAGLGVTVIDADVIAREVVIPDSDTFKEIVVHFGPDVVDKHGALQRHKLRDIIFADTRARAWLEKLLHPLILQEIHQRVKNIRAPYCIAVIPLLLEKNAHANIDRILVIDAPESLQVKRAMLRDDLTESQVGNILTTQLTRAERLAKADDVIVNDGDLNSLQQKVNELHLKYIASVL